MVVALVLRPAAQFIRLLAGAASQLALAVPAHPAGARAPDPIVQQIFVKSETAKSGGTPRTCALRACLTSAGHAHAPRSSDTRGLYWKNPGDASG
eukprot:9014710-Pyramimonas_sp.AAC.1